MEIITRQTAIAVGLNKYFTGVPCKHGHICERYTQTSTCIECLHPSTESKSQREERTRLALEQMRAKSDRRFIRYRLKLLKIGVHDGNLRAVRDFVYTLAAAREPVLQPEDIISRCIPLYRGPNTHLQGFRLFEEDFDLVVSFNKSLPVPAPRRTAVIGEEEITYE